MTSPSPDRYTHFASKQQRLYRNSVTSSIHTPRMDILQLSTFISVQENRISNLMHSFDIDEDHEYNFNSIDGLIETEWNKSLSPFRTPRPALSPPSAPNSLRRDLKPRHVSHPPPD